MAEVKFQGRLRIARIYTNSAEEDYVSIELRDEKSGVHLIDMEMSLPNFASAMFGQERDVDVKMRGADRIGTTRENKTEFVPGERDYHDRDASARKACAPFEVDGWRAYYEGFGNSHKGATRDKVNGYLVAFYRNVRPDGTPVL